MDTLGGRKSSKDKRVLVLSGSGATKPGDIYTLNLATGTKHSQREVRMRA